MYSRSTDVDRAALWLPFGKLAKLVERSTPEQRGIVMPKMAGIRGGKSPPSAVRSIYKLCYLVEVGTSSIG